MHVRLPMVIGVCAAIAVLAAQDGQRPDESQAPTFMIWTAGIGTVLAIVGLVIGLWRHSPSKRYRMEGVSRR